jgi:hypothetical protein
MTSQVGMKMVRLASLTTMMLVSAAPVSAETLSMTCENPHDSNTVVYDPVERRLTVNDTVYVALAFENSEKKTAVAGMVGNDTGLGFMAEFAPTKRIEWHRDDQLLQTDMCH